LALAPVLLLFAWQGRPHAFLACLCVSLASDLVDGYLARRLHQKSELGAKLDSWGDLATYTAFGVGAWWLWPDVIRSEGPFVAVVVASYALPTLLALAKFRRVTSYHTWGAKLSSVLMGAGLLLLFGFQTPWVFRVAAVVLLIAEVEEIAITMVLREWRADVPSVVHAVRLQRAH
jgi:CDP-diacylglycerol---glycerol-3-phosphate 3-phosphatidyltransferase